MSDRSIPSRHYHELARLFPEAMTALENLGATLRSAGPLDAKSSHLIQLAGAAATQSEGAVHSHTRRALAAGASREEIYHALLLLVSTIGFPKVAAAFTWSKDVLEKQG
ncbi:MAG: carboxymuconolactone decarboxylase family protein [Desulfurivibrio sp.]|nr:MAG: carboxymuconolactone decarboxylase family protein [Desulfurivibrio sp.]